jgi:hypothetical protein
LVIAKDTEPSEACGGAVLIIACVDDAEAIGAPWGWE